jgi:hypothetical protein
MNNIFNAKRFGMLFIKHTTEHYKAYLMSWAVLVGVMALGGGFLVYMIEAPIETGMQTAMFGSIFFLAGTMFTSTIFADYGDGKKAAALLTLPATTFEKFLVGWLFSYLIFALVFTGTFYFILVILLSLERIPNFHHEVINVFDGQLITIFVLFSLLHSIAIFGSIFFKKLQFIKTAFCFFISIGVATVVNTAILEMLLGRRLRAAVPFANVDFPGDDRYNRVTGTHTTYLLVICLLLVIALVFWVTTYYKLKEKQV